MVAIPALFRGRKAQNVSDVIVDTLLEWGVDTIFGLPGDGIHGVVESLRRHGDEIRFIQCRHEEAAAFMASGYARFTGRLGVCLATSGAGAIQLLNGLYDARMDQLPVLAITGQPDSDLQGTGYPQDVNLLQLFSDVASACNQGIHCAAQAGRVTEIACRTAIRERTVAHISIPVDVQELPPTESAGTVRRSGTQPRGEANGLVTVPAAAALEQAARVLNRGRKVVILAGQGALGARRELLQVAERLGAPVVKALLGKAVIPDDHPLSAGGLGLLGTRPAEEAMEEADTLFLVGSSFPYTNFLPEGKRALGVQLDVRPERIGLRYPVEAGLVGDAAATLSLLAPLLKKHDQGLLKKTQKRMKEWTRQLREAEEDERRPMRPQAVVGRLSELAPANAVIACDSGTVTMWMARHFRVREEQKFGLSGNLSTMGAGLPYSLAAAVAHPERRSIACVGDGAFTMLMGEFATAVKYRLPVTVVVMKNNTLGQSRWEQLVARGTREWQCDLQPIDFVRFAEACGGVGFRVEDPRELPEVLRKAMQPGPPALVECVVDANEPPMPARASGKQAQQMAELLRRGEPNRERLGLTLFRDRWREGAR